MIRSNGASVNLTLMKAVSTSNKLRAAELAYEQIERMISTLKLEPNQPIVENDLVQMTGLGRTPIREALMQMVANGLIEQQPRRGMRVSEIRIAEHLILIETRKVLERLIAASSAKRATPSQREEILQHANEMVIAAKNNDLEAYMTADKNLDQINYQACRNAYATHAIKPLIIQCRRFWYAYRHDGDLEQGANCHKQLALGISNADQEQAIKGAEALMDYLTEFTHKVIQG